MQRITAFVLSCCVSFSIAWAGNANASQTALTIFVEDFPPFSYAEQTGLQGVALDAVSAIFAEAGVPITRKNLHLVPWARAYNSTLTMPNTAILCMAKNPQRTDKFQWVGPVFHLTVGIITKNGDDHKMFEPNDLQHLLIGVINNSAAHVKLRAMGIPESAIIPLSSPENLIKMLHSGRLDAIAHSVETARFSMNALGLSPDMFKTAYVLARLELHLALNKGTDRRLTARLQKALDRLLCTNGGPGTSAIHELAQPYADILSPGALPLEKHCPAPAQ